MIRGVPMAEIPAMWPRLLPHVETMCARSFSRWHVDGIKERLERGQWQLWVAGDLKGLAFTSINPDSVSVHAVAGTDHKAWSDDGMEAIERWAKALGKSHVVTTCRPGWVKMLRARGFRETHREMVRKVAGE